MSPTDATGARITQLLQDAAPDHVPAGALRAALDRTRALPQRQPVIPLGTGRAARTKAIFGGPGGLAAAAAVAVLLFATLSGLFRSSSTPLASGLASATPSASQSTSPSPSSNSALDRVRAAGSISVGVAQPFVGLPAGGDRYQEFIATELGARLGVTVYLVPMTQDELLKDTAGGAWDIAFPTAAIPHADPRYLATAPYAWVPRYLVVSSATAARGTNLPGRTVCVVAGSSGGAWLSNALNFLSPGTVVRPPRNAKALTLPSDAACLDAVRAGRADAAVTRDLLKRDIDASPGVAIQGGVLYHDPLVIIVAHSLPELDGRLLFAQIEPDLEDLRSSAKLHELSGAAFDLVDLSVPTY
jgi:ABC-type amino acid transport substrate-binding protein